jgi:acetylornithine deacetylase/succinyl-diaminopimelate desuccinylase-like protein
MTLLLAVGLGALFAAGEAPAQTTSPYGDEAVRTLQEYLRLDTTNPPGNELRAATFLKAVFDREGIPSAIDEFAPGRANILATLKGSGAKRPLVLAGHVDVVPADASHWSVPPFSGDIRAGLLYGRGAQDMKDEGIIHLMTLLRLKRERVPLDRDVLFLGTADEEEGMKGALRAISPEGFRTQLGSAEYLVTEGGEGRVGPNGAPLYFGVDTAEKAAFWLSVKAEGQPGHAAEPIAESAPNRLIRALDRIRGYKTTLKVLPVVQRYLQDLAPRVDARRAPWYKDVRAALARPEVADALSADQTIAPLLRNTISITVLRSGYKTNVIPATAEAQVDVRLLPGEDPQAFLRELNAVVDDPAVAIAPLGPFFEPNSSPVDSEVFREISRTLARHYPGVPVTPSLLTGATESVLYRRLGIASYGFTPVLASGDELDSQHGDDERIRETSLRTATDIFYEVISNLCRHSP